MTDHDAVAGQVWLMRDTAAARITSLRSCRMTWLDRLLIKIAVSKAVARGYGNPEAFANRLADAFRLIDSSRSDTSQSAPSEAP